MSQGENKVQGSNETPTEKLRSGLGNIKGDQWLAEDFTTAPVDGGVRVTGLASGVTKHENMSIPEKIGEQPVVEIGNWAFRYVPNGNKLTGSVTIPDTVRTIGEFAFSDNEISKLNFSNHSALESIGTYAFSSNEISQLTLPSTVKSISNDVFYNNSISKLSFPNDSELKSIGEYAFSNNDISELNFPNNSVLESIGRYAFNGNEISQLTLPVTVKTIDDGAFYANNISKLNFSNNSILESIGEYAFSDNEISQLTLPGTVKSINDGAFYDNDISKLNFSNNSVLESIGEYAFSRNEIPQLTLPGTIKSIKNGAFAKNYISKLDFQNSSVLESIGMHAFNSNRISQLILPGTIKSIDDGAFSNNQIETLSLANADQIEWADVGAFNNQTLEKAVPFSAPLPLKNFQPQIRINHNNSNVTVNQFDVTDVSDASYSSGQFTGFKPNSQFRFKLTPTNYSNEPSPGINDIIEKLDYSATQTIKVGDPVPPSTPENSGQDNQLRAETTAPQPTPDKSTIEPVNEPETGITTPPSARSYPAYVYNKRTIRRHRNANLNAPVKTYRQTVRHQAQTFRVLGTAKSTGGALRYRVKGGYITANKRYVANLFYQRNTKRVRVIAPKGIRQYQDAKLTKRVSHMKTGQVLRVKRLVKVGQVTRYQLTNGNYITANKTMVIWQ